MIDATTVDRDPFAGLVDYTFDPTTEWSDADAAALETCLKVADHFDDDHDPVHCQVDAVRSTDPRGGHQERGEWRLLREGAGLTLRQLARRIGVRAETVSRYETNRREPEDEHAYFAFLRGQGDELAGLAPLRVFMLQRKRDGWWGVGGAPWTQDARDAHWEILYKPGGLFDRWRDTGTLPVWTPADAGFATA